MSDAAAERLTPAGVGGVAVVAVRSADARARLAALFDAELPSAGAVAYGVLREPDAGQGAAPIDEVLVVGRTDGTHEVHLHGSPAVVAEVLPRLGATPPTDDAARLPLEERARRAAPFAPTALGARLLLDQAGGALRRELEALRDATPEERARALAELAARGARTRRLLTPSIVALTGPTNAGKSTLFNALVGEEVAAVTDVHGTTRDAVGARARLGPWPVIVVDTAGLRDLTSRDEPAASVERAGQELGRRAARRADVQLLLIPETDVRPPEIGDAVLVRTQAARTEGPDPSQWGGTEWRGTRLSALEAPEHARATIARLFVEHLGLGDPEGPAWTAGTAVPFEDALVARMSDLATSGSVERSALDSLLGDL